MKLRLFALTGVHMPILFGLLVGCAAPAPYEFTQEMKRINSIEGAKGKPETGALGRAINEQNIWLARRWVEIDDALSSNDLNRATGLIDQVAQVDPSNPRLKGARLSLQLKSELPKLPITQAPIAPVLAESSEVDIAVGKKLPVLEFRDAPLRAVMEALGRIGSLNFIFDKDVRTDNRVSVSFKDASIKDALKAILITQQLDFKAFNRNSIIIYPNTAAKIRDYVDLQSRSFFLDNIDAKQAQALIRTLVKTRDIFIDEKLNLLVMKDSPAAIRYAEQLIESVDQAEPEVVLDVQVLEVSASRSSEVGLKLPSSASLGLPLTTPLTTALTRSNWADQIISITSPSISASLRAGLGDANLLSNPSIRVKNREKARIHIGEKLPVFTSVFNSTGVAGSSASAFSTQVTLLEVGLKLDVEPLVHMSKEVEIKLALEVSNVIERVIGPAQSVGYRVGTRNAVTNLRLRDGETQILAGLIRDDERRSTSGVPGLMELPILGRLFGPQTIEKDKTEIILLITPRIVRSIDAPLIARSPLTAGTDGAVGAAPLRMNESAVVAISPTVGGSSRVPPGRPGVRVAPVENTEPQAPARISLSLTGPKAVAPNADFEVVLVRNPGQPMFNVAVDLSLKGTGAIFSGGQGGSSIVNLSGEQSSVRIKAGAAGSDIDVTITSAKTSTGDLQMDSGPQSLQVKVEAK
jgi:general secretion pathway protein D